MADDKKIVICLSRDLTFFSHLTYFVDNGGFTHAVARALINQPKLLLADEPTGNLDHETGQDILNLFQEIRQNIDMTILMVTHDRNIANLADRTIELTAGKLS